MIADPALDLQGDALLLAVIEREGDLPRAFVALCACARPGDLAGDTFERALERAVRRLMTRTAPRLIGPAGPVIDREEVIDV